PPPPSEAEDARAGARPEIEHVLTLVQVRDGGGDPAAERRLHGGLRSARSVPLLVKGAAEHERPGLVGVAHVPLRERAPPGAAARGRAGGGGACSGRVALPHVLAN